MNAETGPAGGHPTRGSFRSDDHGGGYGCRACGEVKPVRSFPTLEVGGAVRSSECRACRDGRRRAAGARPEPLPAGQRTKRVLYCRSCGHSTGIPGAVYCDPCRPARRSDELMTPIDWARERP